MMLVADGPEVFILVVERGIGLMGLDGRVRVGPATRLLKELADMIVVNMVVVTGPDESARLGPDLLCCHCGEQQVGGGAERHAGKYIVGTLMQLAV